MKQPDKFLLAIVTVIILLVIAAFVTVLLRPQPQYRRGETAEDIVYNYLLALQQEEYERALDLIAQDVPNRPQDSTELAWAMSQDRWQFGLDSSPSREIIGSRISGDNATVTIQETHADNSPFGSSYTEEITMRLKREESGWKLSGGQRYWSYEWVEE